MLEGERGGLFFAALLFGSGLGELLVELLDASVLRIEEASGLFEVGGGVAATFFETGECGGGFGCSLLQEFALLAKGAELLL